MKLLYNAKSSYKIHTLRGGGTGLCIPSMSDISEQMLSVDLPFDSLLDGAGGGGFCGLLTTPNLSLFLSEDMTSLVPEMPDSKLIILNEFHLVHSRLYRYC